MGGHESSFAFADPMLDDPRGPGEGTRTRTSVEVCRP